MKQIFHKFTRIIDAVLSCALLHSGQHCQRQRPQQRSLEGFLSTCMNACTSFHFHFQVQPKWREWSMCLGKFWDPKRRHFYRAQQPKVSDFVPQQNEKNLWLLGVKISVFRAGKPGKPIHSKHSHLSGVAGSLWYLSWNHWQTDDQKIGNVQAGGGAGGAKGIPNSKLLNFHRTDENVKVPSFLSLVRVLKRCIQVHPPSFTSQFTDIPMRPCFASGSEPFVRFGRLRLGARLCDRSRDRHGYCCSLNEGKRTSFIKFPSSCFCFLYFQI